MIQRQPHRVLGISAFFHDSSAALVEDGRVVACAAEERFTRIRHDASFPTRAVEFCLSQARVAPQELDAVVFYEQPHVKFTRVLASTLADFPRSRGRFVGAMKQWFASRLWTKNEISRRLNIHPRLIRMLPHHQSHALQAFAASGFEDAAVLTLDGVGEWTTTAIAHARRSSTPGDAPLIQPLGSLAYPHSIGLVYAAFTAFLGFRPNDGECSTMALAAFGQPRFADEVKRVLKPTTDGMFEVDAGYLDFLADGQALFTRRFTALFGEPRDRRDVLPFDAMSDAAAQPPVTAEQQRYADIAASIQRVTEELMLGLARRARRLSGSTNLCLAGGVAMNAVAVARIVEAAGFERVFIPPDPGDGGAAIGAAMAVSGTAVTSAAVGPYVGAAFDESLDRRMLAEFDPASWSPYMRPGCTGITADQLEVRAELDDEALIGAAAADLAAGRIVGWYQGRFELGPRALGNRSLLCDASNIAAARRLSTHIKSRAAFRPYALSITEEDAARVLELPSPTPMPARWMQMTARVRPEYRAAVRAAVHVDGTTRPQVCGPDDNPLMHRLLCRWGQARGLAGLLNTSMNEDGYPIVSTPAEALIVLARTDLDTLIINRTVLRKVR